MDELKKWKCGKGHVLGVIERKQVRAVVGGLKVEYFTAQLLIYRNGVDLDAGKPEVAGSIYGRMLLGFSWNCNVPGCGCVKEWHPGEDALEWLRNRYAKDE